MCRRIKRASLVVPFTRRISIIVTRLTATTQSNLALQDRACLSTVPFLSLAWEWYASIVVTHIVIGIVVGQENVCGPNHEDVVFRKNPHGKLYWEEISSSTSKGTMQMAGTPTQYLPAPPTQQYLMAPPVTSTIISTPQPRAY
jgi:hypothetical protein